MRLALRSLRQKPVFALTAILTIAIGIGANTALFGVIYSVLLRPLPFRDPSELVQIWETHPALPQLQAAVPDFEDWRRDARSFEQMSAYTLSAMNTGTMFGVGEPARVHATMASGDFFSNLGIRPLTGRAFNEDEDRAKQHVALISENLWRSKFDANPAVIGREIRVDTDSFRVIGVVSQRQAFPEWADLWIPLSLIEPGLRTVRKFHPLEVVARLKPGVTAEQAQVEMQTIAHGLAQGHPDTNGTIGAYVIPLAREITGTIRPALLLAWGAVGLVLLIACANLAHLFLGRIFERRQEMAIREALGAQRWHLIRQLLSESLVVAAIGGAAGFLLAAWAGQLLFKIAASQIPRLEPTATAPAIWLFAIAISLIAGLLFGLPSCWEVLRSKSNLADSGRSIIHARSRFSAVLMAGEVAMALLVLAGAALLSRSFAALLNENPGFRAENVLVIPNLSLRPDWDKSAEFLTTRLAPALRNVPGVVDVAAANAAPMSLLPTEHSRFATRFGVDGKTFDPGSYPVAQNRWITPDYFRALSIPLHRGRWLTEADRKSGHIIVNETLAQRFFPHGDAVGKRLIFGVMDASRTYAEIVGVVGDTRDMGLDQPVELTSYAIVTGPVTTLLVKTETGSSELASVIRAAIHQVDPEIPVSKIQPLEDNLRDSLARRRFALILLAIFGGLAAFLTASGIFAVLSQSVNARIREFGVRAAVGARPRDVLSMILREAFVLALPGLLAGLLLTFSFARIMRTLVYQLSPLDPVSLGSAGGALLLLVLFSAWLPARRAAAVDPMQALRTE